MPARLTLILPTLNEAGNIVPQINEVLAVLSPVEIIVVDDNSTDGTREEVKSAFPKEIEAKSIKIVHRTKDFGLTASLKEGFLESTSDLIGWMDCDCSMPAELLPQMINKLDSGFDVVVGSRFITGGKQKDFLHVKNDSRSEIILSNALNFFLKIVLRLSITDFTSGYIVARRSALAKTKWCGRHGEYFIHLISQFQKNGERMTELPYICRTRKHGTSKTFGSIKLGAINSFRYSTAVLKLLGGKITSL